MTLYDETVKLSDLWEHTKKARKMVGGGNEILLTGLPPVWLYLKISHVLYGKTKRLIYRFPVTGDVEIFDHDSF